MSISAEIFRIEDHNEDHEVGGLDLPVTVALETSREHTLTVLTWSQPVWGNSLGSVLRVLASRQA
jgi:hypothetical protein